MRALTTKRRFYELWEQGALGNKPRTWNSLEEAVESGFAGAMALRYKGFGGNGPFVTDLALDRLAQELEKLARQGWRKEDFLIAEQLSPGVVPYLINGEVMRSHRGLELTFSTANLLMRDALRTSGRSVSGMTAQEVMRHYLGSGDYEEILDLLDVWPDHVVEFSGFGGKVGVYEQRMVIWEVRLY